MNDRLVQRMAGLEPSLTALFGKVAEGPAPSIRTLTQTMTKEMESLGYDKITTDELGNVIGVIKGYRHESDMLILAHVDLDPAAHSERLVLRDANGDQSPLAGAIAAIYAGALLKRSIAAMSGDLIVSIVPGFRPCSFGTHFLFQSSLKDRKLKGVILAEPTDLNIYLGNKGMMEYEIIINGIQEEQVIADNQLTAMSTMYPLIKRLGDVSKKLPHSSEFGSSSLKIKDILYNAQSTKAFQVAVDRIFVPEETSGEIIQRARSIAESIYQDQPGTNVAVRVKTETMQLRQNRELVLTNEVAPWKMESHHPFVTESLQVLKENGTNASVGYWKTLITEGSHTCGSMGIPTLGFGAGTEDTPFILGKTVTLDALEKSICGKAMIVYRNIGFPTFGWSDDEF